MLINFIDKKILFCVLFNFDSQLKGFFMLNNEQISYAKTVYGQEEIDAVVKCLNESTQMGNYSRKFEAKIAKLFEKEHCLFVNSGSSALL